MEGLPSVLECLVVGATLSDTTRECSHKNSVRKVLSFERLIFEKEPPQDETRFSAHFTKTRQKRGNFRCVLESLGILFDRSSTGRARARPHGNQVLAVQVPHLKKSCTLKN